jgi:hypothetical protein
MEGRLMAILAVLVVLGGCVSEGAVESPEVEVPPMQNLTVPAPVGNGEEDLSGEGPEFLKGVSLSPKSGSAEDFVQFFEEAGEAGEIVMWAGDWEEMDAEGGGPAVVCGLASTYGYIPLVEVTYYTQGEGELVRPLDEEAKRRYKEKAVAFIEEYGPEYLGIGIEVNVMEEKSPEDFEEFVEFYSEVYYAVKEKSPGTKVFTVFALEKMKGLHGGLFGGENNPENAQWELIERFPADLVAFSSYPGLIYEEPEEIPEDYYLEIEEHVEGPIAFTELGWHTSDSIEGWESSEAEQARFVQRFFGLTEGMEKEIVVWSFLYDPEIFEPFGSMGLRRDDGGAKEAWGVWVSAG